MFFAMFLMKHEEDLNTAKTIFTAIGLLIPPLVMIYRQPDLKNTITVMVLFCFMMYVAGLSYKVIAVVLVSGSALVLALLLVITQVNFQLPAALDKTIGYQLGRIQDWLSDDADNADGRLQQQNSITAIGSGKLTGKGLNNNKVSSANKGNFVSQNHNDFIFAVAGEELGFFGCCGIIPAPVPDSRRMHPDFPESKRSVRNVDLLRYGRTHCLSELSEYQCCNRNPAGTPVTPLPFVSYGLTSLVTLYIGMGLVLNVGLQNRDFVTRNYELLRRKTSMNIGLIAHDAKKTLLQNLCIAYRSVLAKHTLYATGTSGRLVEEATDLTSANIWPDTLEAFSRWVLRLNRMILDLVIFLRDPEQPKQHEPDVHRIIRLCDVHSIPLATNLATAEMLIKSLDRGEMGLA